MKQIEKIKLLVSMLEENVEMLEGYQEKEKEWQKAR